MTALAKDRNTHRREGVELEYPVAADTVIYGGGMVALNTSGYAVPGADTANFKFVGVAVDRADNTGGDAGEMSRSWSGGSACIASPRPAWPLPMPALRCMWPTIRPWPSQPATAWPAARSPNS